jgi:hypothetical protein
MKSVALILFLIATPATAAPITVEGITFSDEQGGFSLRRVTGTGSLADPFVVVEDVTGSEPTLVIRFLDNHFGNRIGTRDPLGMALVKVVTNYSGTIWYGYRMEARKLLAQPSPDSDGLSLGQGWRARPPVVSSGFRHVRVIDQPHDAINFDDGRIEESQAVSFTFVLTDTLPTSEIFLLQQPETDIACAWPPRAAVC